MDTIIADAYSAFNRRDIEAALALMTEDVSWPKASEGGKVVGKDEVRSYWTRQWREFNPTVEPLAIDEDADGKWKVKVHQLVRDLKGEVLFEGEVVHVFTFDCGLIAAMELGDTHDAGGEPTAAFTRHVESKPLA